MVAVCFVCLGNICRSPTAEGVFLHLLAERGWTDRVRVDSAGTAGYHVGHRPDPRSLAAAARRGIELPSRARRFEAEDLARFDLVLAMDAENLADLRAMARDEAEAARVRLFREFDPASGEGAEVPDPYYGGEDGFETVLDLCFAAAEGLLDELGPRLAP
ncbi:MAG: low molecular weight protein-tyrosine-phosphatase [Planctomycetota bacterium]